MKVVSPVGEGGRTRFRLPQAPKTLGSATVGILSNGKVNATPLLREIAALLIDRKGMRPGAVLSMTEKADGPGFPAPGWMLETLTSGSGLSLVGVGD
jgi:hypothetical protein